MVDDDDELSGEDETSHSAETSEEARDDEETATTISPITLTTAETSSKAAGPSVELASGRIEGRTL